jgi:hypothetical protein
LFEVTITTSGTPSCSRSTTTGMLMTCTKAGWIALDVHDHSSSGVTGSKVGTTWHSTSSPG